MPPRRELDTNATTYATTYTAPTPTFDYVTLNRYVTADSPTVTLGGTDGTAWSAWNTDELTVNAQEQRNTLTVEYLDRKVRIEIDKILDRYFRKIFEVLKREYDFSISEEDFMKLIKED